MKEEIGRRLKEERKRLMLTQEAFAEICGVSVNTIVRYESGSHSPDAKLLANIADQADVLYILTGQRQQTEPAPAERPVSGMLVLFF